MSFRQRQYIFDVFLSNWTIISACILNTVKLILMKFVNIKLEIKNEYIKSSRLFENIEKKIRNIKKRMQIQVDQHK